MYGWDTLVLLQHLLDEGLSKTAIAQRLGVSRRVIYHWIKTGQLTRDVDAPAVRHAASRATKLGDYHAIITERLTTYPELSAVRLFAEVQAAGYAGGITQVRDYVARVRPRLEPEPVVRFETAPGHQTADRRGIAAQCAILAGDFVQFEAGANIWVHPGISGVGVC